MRTGRCRSGPVDVGTPAPRIGDRDDEPKSPDSAAPDGLAATRDDLPEYDPRILQAISRDDQLGSVFQIPAIDDEPPADADPDSPQETMRSDDPWYDPATRPETMVNPPADSVPALWVDDPGDQDQATWLNELYDSALPDVDLTPERGQPVIEPVLTDSSENADPSQAAGWLAGRELDINRLLRETDDSAIAPQVPGPTPESVADILRRLEVPAARPAEPDTPLSSATAFNPPAAPEVQQPAAPEVEPPVVPIFEQPAAAEVEPAVVPIFQQPAAPEVQQPATPVSPAMEQPAAAEIQQPAAPEVEPPVVPIFEQPAAAEFQQPATPVSPAMEQPAAAAFQQPAAPEFQQPAVAEFQQPAVAEFQQPAAAEVEPPVVPIFEQPAAAEVEPAVVPIFEQPAAAEFQQPATPVSRAMEQPAAPEVQQPAAPEFQQPAVAEFQQPATPEFQQPAAPEVEPPVVPIFEQPAAAEFQQPAAPESNPTVDPEVLETPASRAEDRLARLLATVPASIEQPDHQPAESDDPASPQFEEPPSALSPAEPELSLPDEPHEAPPAEVEPGKRDVPTSGPNESVAEVLQRMRQSGELATDLSFESAPVEKPSMTVPQPAPHCEAQADGPSEPDVTDYMNQLMTRLRGTGQPLPAAQSLPATPKAPAAPQAKQLEDELIPKNPLPASEFIPRASAPEKSTTLNALRQIANQSVQSAIQNSVRKKNWNDSLVYLAGTSVAFFLSVVLFVLSDSWFDLSFILACLSAVVCAVTGYMFISVNMAIEKLVEAHKLRKEQASGNCDADDLPVGQLDNYRLLKVLDRGIQIVEGLFNRRQPPATGPASPTDGTPDPGFPSASDDRQS